ncbi:MAG: hypothetical protein JKY81_08370 [Colwellia sp.]|nr:hypothetical protein [Colwellia sp.]
MNIIELFTVIITATTPTQPLENLNNDEMYNTKAHSLSLSVLAKNTMVPILRVGKKRGIIRISDSNKKTTQFDVISSKK